MRASAGDFLTSVNFLPDLAVSQRDVPMTRGESQRGALPPSVLGAQGKVC